MILAQISDTHITRPGRRVMGLIDTAPALECAVAALNGLDPLPDLAVLTGDLVDVGDAAEYEHLCALLAPLRMPLLVIPGNHDAREPLRQAFGGAGYLPRHGFLDYVVDHGALRLVALDTLVEGKSGGALGGERLAWLDRALAAAPERPTVLLMHHPPFATGIGPMDRAGLADSGKFAEIVARHPQIERILAGHLHRPIDRRFAGTIAGTAPSTAHQVVLDLRAGADLCFAFEPAGYQLHCWKEAEGLVTHTALIGAWSGPYSFAGARAAAGVPPR